MGDVATPDDDLLLKNFFAEVSEVERENEVHRILSCFKLNAFEYLNLPFDSSLEDVKKQYRKVIISPPLELIEGFSQQFESLLVGL
ncbi:hypothetical protein RHGRI_002138 [Rhododendron griersonianum]|uniref:Uncharacterized protein n=1 Tax=Rhododendron griersonianum TaxID=479676 RepID=A0AAV6LMQ3_9ERIC|nr:hypothetical protein RHGRI_002138 [Rhododendron griersonianum]